MGVLFQIQDDVLDIYGAKGRDRVGSDIAEGKRSILIVHALNHAEEARAQWIEEVIDTPRDETTDAAIQEMSEVLRQLGSLDYALDELERRHSQSGRARAQHRAREPGRRYV